MTRRFFGKNKLNTKDLFQERSRYQKWMDSYNNLNKKFIDLWYDHPFYGRINRKGKIVYPKKSSLDSIAQRHQRDLYAINFVADMFNDFVEYWNNLQSAQKLHPESFLLTFTPQRSWQNVDALYHNYMNGFYLGFTDALRQTGQRPKDFEEMMNFVISFMKSSPKFMILTKSTFVTSRYSEPLVSGLMIDILEKRHGSDTEKEDFLNDNNFKIFKNTAQKFGFKLDENAPWRLIADIDSPAIEPYLEARGLKKKEIFDELYHIATDDDIEMVKTYMTGFWNKLVSQNFIQQAKNKIKDNIYEQRSSKKLIKRSKSTIISEPKFGPGEVPSPPSDPIVTPTRAWLPTDLGSVLFAWWDPADSDTVTLDGSNFITQIDDKSGNERHLVDDGTPALTVGTINGVDAAATPATVSHLGWAGDLDDATAFYTVADTAADTRYIYIQDSASFYLGVADSGSTNTTLENPSTGSEYWVDGVQESPSTRGDWYNLTTGKHIVSMAGLGLVGTGWNNWNIFGYGSGFELDNGFYGDHVLTGNLTTEERQKLEGYLAHKYGLEGNLPVDHPYKAAAPTVEL